MFVSSAFDNCFNNKNQLLFTFQKFNFFFFFGFCSANELWNQKNKTSSYKNRFYLRAMIWENGSSPTTSSITISSMRKEEKKGSRNEMRLKSFVSSHLTCLWMWLEIFFIFCFFFLLDRDLNMKEGGEEEKKHNKFSSWWQKKTNWGWWAS